MSLLDLSEVEKEAERFYICVFLYYRTANLKEYYTYGLEMHEGPPLDNRIIQKVGGPC